MTDSIALPYVADAVAEAIQRDICFLSGPGQARHVPFAFTPTLIAADRLDEMIRVAPLFGRLLHRISEDHGELRRMIEPLAPGDPFFAALLRLHAEIHSPATPALRRPLLVQRTDFMEDMLAGPRLVECNSIAAGMGPFGARMQGLHSYLRQCWPAEFARWSDCDALTLVPNPAADRLADALAQCARQVRVDHEDLGDPHFLMIVQENEDNIFDQRLLLGGLRERGVVTHQRTFRELRDDARSGPNGRLWLRDLAAVDVVYLRAGYQYHDYVAMDLQEEVCCQALSATRRFLEQHAVAINATVGQQLAGSKRVQMILSQGRPEDLERFGLRSDEATRVFAHLTEMRGIDASTLGSLGRADSSRDWVLKNQGEGGGHCLFDEQIAGRLAEIDPRDYPAWSLMRRLHPRQRARTTLAIRDGRGHPHADLVSEIGIFTVHFEGESMCPEDGYAGYLVRSKPASVTEGGVHSGYGILDSLATAR